MKITLYININGMNTLNDIYNIISVIEPKILH